MSIVQRIVALCCHHAIAVVVLVAALSAASVIYVAGHFAMNTDSSKLINEDVAWRMRQAQFDAAFPQNTNLILVVIDGKTPELAESAAARLTERLRTQAGLFQTVRRPDGGAFFNQNGLLFLSEKEVADTTAQLIKAQPFLGPLASDPSLRGLMSSLDTVLLGVSAGQATLADIDAPLRALAPVFEDAARGQVNYLSWRSLFTGAAPKPEELRRFIAVQPVLDFTALQPGQRASDAIRTAARGLNIDPAHGVTVRLTGDVPMSDEEFSTLADRAELMMGAMIGSVLLLLWLALKSVRLMTGVMLTLFAGLIVTMAAGLMMVGVFNIISIAFIALFVGLGVDFGIQFAVRYRHERHHTHNLDKALSCAGAALGAPLALASAATAAGFFSFLPTTYTGVAELGMVAGIGMVVAFIMSITLLPALIKLLKPRAEGEDVGFAWMKPADVFVTQYRRPLVIGAGLLGVVCAGLMFFVSFDSDPLNLRSPDVESVATLRDLMASPLTSPNIIDIPAPTLAQADVMAARVSRLPEVGQTITLNSFIPEGQERKLALIADANNLLGVTIAPFEVMEPPSDAEVMASLAKTAAGLRAAATGNDGAAQNARRMAAALDAVVKAGPAARAHATEALVPGLKTMLDQVAMSLTAQAVTIESMPAEMRLGWVSASGIARVQVSPKDTSNSPESVLAFTNAVRAVAPDSNGAPISIYESGKTIVGAFLQAGVLSFIAITILLAITLRRTFDVLMTLLPLLLTGLLTLATCVLIGQKLNFANIIALPLLLGIGVAFNIYFVMAWRAGAKNLLQSSLTRAVIFSAATTATGFGALWLSIHPGTASMGQLLMISLFWALMTTLFLTPALLGPPPKKKDQVDAALIH
jgi:hopanoid biosynthesis associated RND transporter like protein HpnN